MRHEETEVALVGAQSGAAIALALVERGIQVTGIDRGDAMASTLQNQRWKHSGSWYWTRDVALKLLEAFRTMHPLERQHLLSQGGHFLFHTVEACAEWQQRWCDWGIPFVPLVPETLHIAASLGNAACRAGVQTADSVLDFPALTADLRAQAQRLGARLVPGIVTRLVRDDSDAVTGVVYAQQGVETLLHCRHCVVAAGGWTPELLRTAGVEVPVQRCKSCILTAPGELVQNITVFRDAPVVTIVPYQHTTLFADQRRFPAVDGDDRMPIPDAIEALKDDMVACFPALDRRLLAQLQAHFCLKLEADFSGTGAANQDTAVFTPLPGLTVAIPGKASLMFMLARELAEHVTGVLRRTAVR